VTHSQFVIDINDQLMDVNDELLNKFSHPA